MLLKEFLPKDFTSEEMDLLEVMAIRIYQRLYDPLDKFILMAVYEMSYPKQAVADAIGISYNSLHKRIEKIKVILNSNHKPPKWMNIKNGSSQKVYHHYYKSLELKGEI